MGHTNMQLYKIRQNNVLVQKIHRICGLLPKLQFCKNRQNIVMAQMVHGVHGLGVKLPLCKNEQNIVLAQKFMGYMIYKLNCNFPKIDKIF